MKITSNIYKLSAFEIFYELFNAGLIPSLSFLSSSAFSIRSPRRPLTSLSISRAKAEANKAFLQIEDPIQRTLPLVSCPNTS